MQKKSKERKKIEKMKRYKKMILLKPQHPKTSRLLYKMKKRALESL